jgi:ER lumen protein retaining receptor
LAVCFYPPFTKHFTIDIVWMFSAFLESVAVLPQLFLFHRMKVVKSFTTHFLATQALARFAAAAFWMSIAHEFNDDSHYLTEYTGYTVVGAHILQVAVMADFLYVYICAWRQGVPVSELLIADVV